MAIYKITVPVENFGGKRLGLTFRKGVATTDDKKIADMLKERGYKVTSVKGGKDDA